MTLNQTLRLQLCIRIGHGGAVHTQHIRQLAASRNAVTMSQIARVHQRPQLIAQLNV
jgi:purine-nucleoside phosphorylase